jgi:hypothetical protein
VSVAMLNQGSRLAKTSTTLVALIGFDSEVDESIGVNINIPYVIVKVTQCTTVANHIVLVTRLTFDFVPNPSQQNATIATYFVNAANRNLAVDLSN